MNELETEPQLRTLTEFMLQGVRRFREQSEEAVAGANADPLSPAIRQFSDTSGQIVAELEKLLAAQSTVETGRQLDDTAVQAAAVSTSLLRMLDDLFGAALSAKAATIPYLSAGEPVNVNGEVADEDLSRRSVGLVNQLHDDVLAFKDAITRTVAAIRHTSPTMSGAPRHPRSPDAPPESTQQPRHGPVRANEGNAETDESRYPGASIGPQVGRDGAGPEPGHVVTHATGPSAHPSRSEEAPDAVSTDGGPSESGPTDSRPPHADARRGTEPSIGHMPNAARSARKKREAVSRGSDSVFWCLVVLVVLCPLPYAAVLPWSQGILACATVALLVAWSVQAAFASADTPFGLYDVRWIVLPFLLVVAWAAMQGLPITPTAWHHTLWQAARGGIELPVVGTVSLDPFVTGSALALLLSYAGVFWLSLQLCHDPGRARWAMRVVTVAGLAYAAYGFVAQILDAEAVLAQSRIVQKDALTSTFVNRNNFATYAGLALICSTGLFFRHFNRSFHSAGRSRKLIWVLANDLPGWGVVIIGAWFMLITAVLLTYSRGGFFSTALGLIALLVVVGIGTAASLRQMAIVAVPVLVAGISFFFLSGEVTSQRLARTAIDSEGRFSIYESTIDGIARAPLKGTGYGTFYDSFRLIRDQSASFNFARAHNTYLENALELGVPAASVLVLAVIVMGWQCAAGARRSERSAIHAGVGIGATVLVGAHAMVDFSLQIPAVAVTYMFVMGAAVAQSRRVS